ncbi:MAG: hypothetical protein HC842_02615 [Cytophagales bacterium]|nr:hypothetical protein [Cytophagales bacterium]
MPSYEGGFVRGPLDFETTIIFKVQVGVFDEPLNPAKADELFITDFGLEVSPQNGKYLYLLGYCPSYDDAVLIKNRSNIKGAFIVAYKAGKPIKITKQLIDAYKKTY